MLDLVALFSHSLKDVFKFSAYVMFVDHALATHSLFDTIKVPELGADGG